jgi:CRP/FNR family transcriptional regulator
VAATSDTTSLPPGCSRCSVRSKSLCSVLSHAELWAINAISRHRHFDSGQVIVTEGEPDIFANIVSGMVVEKKGLADGREQIVSLLFPADFLGNSVSRESSATVQAVGPVTLCTFDRAGFEDAMQSFPALKQAVFDHALSELQHAREWMLLLGQKAARERVATFLLRLATRKADAGCSHFAIDMADDGAEFEIPITRAQMASYLGLTIETVSRKLGALRDMGAIDLVGARTVRIANVDRLRSAVG